jgi:hypothetical protein
MAKPKPKSQPKPQSKPPQSKPGTGVKSTTIQNNVPIKPNTLAISSTAGTLSTTKPLNISSRNIVGECKLKCDYSFNYTSVSNPTATNYGTYIQITYNDNPCVIYNNVQYRVSNINIYSPSLHYYNDSSESGELCIRHVPLYGGNSLLIYIPISTSGLTVSASPILSNIISAVSKMAPSAGQNTNKGTGTFTLNDFIPKKSFYNYTTGTNDVIVYGNTDAIGISLDNYNILNKIIIPVTNNPAIISTSLFFNTSGPSVSSSLSNLTMDCQALDIGEPAEEYIKNKPSSVDDFMKGDEFVYLIIILIIILVFVVAYLLKNYFIDTLEMNIKE